MHFTYSGHWLMAIILAEHITREILEEPWQEALVPSLAKRDDLCGVMIQDHIVAKGMIKVMLRQAPLDRAADVELQLAATDFDIERFVEELSPAEQAVVRSLTLSQLQSDMIRQLALNYEDAEMYREEMAVLRRGVHRQPWRPDLLLDLAECELRDGNDLQARALLEEADKWRSNRVRLRDLQQKLDPAGKP